MGCECVRNQEQPEMIHDTSFSMVDTEEIFKGRYRFRKKKERHATFIQTRLRMRDYTKIGILGKGHNITYLYKSNTEKDRQYAVRENVVRSDSEFVKICLTIKSLDSLYMNKHPNILDYEGYAVDDNVVSDSRLQKFKIIYIITEAGKMSMNDLILQRQKEEEYLTFKSASIIMAGLFSGLAELHYKDITHCDIKPSNIIITHDGTYKLGDLGEVKNIIHRAALQHTLTTSLDYAAPEIIEMFNLTNHLSSNF